MCFGAQFEEALFMRYSRTPIVLLSFSALTLAYLLNGCSSGSSSSGSNGGGNQSTYTIGGTISGLTAAGLSLKETTSGQTVSPAANATSFTFPTAVASGATYSVTVSAQPAGESCTVSNGSGTVGSSNVTSVQVACKASASYTIGGSITGLTTSGLILANGADTVSPVANATSFTFPTAVASGGSYSVTVSAQPAGESCTVSNGSGTVGSSNVTSVQVTCTTSNSGYTIGGLISGLTSAGLSLKESISGQTVSPAANAASFTFPTAVASGASYSVTVSVQPAGETCTVSNGSGTVASSNVTSVQVTCTASASYTIGGTISGLTASGLTLANGADMVSPVANAISFTFPIAVASGASYSVTVSAQPTGETCTVSNGSGTVASSNVTSVQVACTPTNTQTFIPLVVMPAAPANAASGIPYSQTLTASGTGPFSWTGSTVVDGSSSLNTHVNNDLSLSIGGVLSGTPYYTGLQSLALSVSRADGASAFVETELPISGVGSTQDITNSPLPATQGQSYSWQAQTTWGYTGSNLGCTPGLLLVFGSIPPGLTFNPLNTTTGSLFGTPTIAGTYTMTLMADPGTTLCAPEPTNFKTVTLTVAPAAAPTTPAGSSNWTRQATTAVLTPSPSGWDSYLLGSPSVIMVGSSYYMYYEGLNTTSDTHSIGLATSSDGLNWTKKPVPVLQPTAAAWDMTEVRYPAVVNNSGNFLMVYQGTGSGTALGLATSTDGVTWTKHSGAVVTTTGVHSAYVPGTLLYVGGQYVLFYTVDGYIGSMTSPDGVTWTDNGAVFSPNGNGVTFSRPAIIYDGTKYRMWYSRIVDANDGTIASSGLYTVTIGYADSPDGKTWTTYGNPIFTAGATGTWDRPGVGDPSVFYDGKTYRMWYVGGREQLPGGTPDSDTWVEGSIGYALIP
jgi:predicted GH43/DUF377 family glycosyl hydrolase